MALTLTLTLLRKCECLDPALCGKQSNGDVTIHAVDDPNTKSITEKTGCNFQCQEGYFDEDKGDKKILFECEAASDRTQSTGTTKTAPTQCQGACLICVLTFSIALYSGPVDAVLHYHQSLLTYFSLHFFLTVIGG